MKDYLERYNPFFLAMIKIFRISENDHYGRTNIMDMAKNLRRGGRGKFTFWMLPPVVVRIF